MDLGLSIAQEIIRQHSGSLEIISELKKAQKQRFDCLLIKLYTTFVYN